MISTERISDKTSLLLNSCGIDRTEATRRGSVRPQGRVDYHLLYIARGECHVVLSDGAHTVGDGGLIFFFPGERQEYFLSRIRARCPITSISQAEMRIRSFGLSAFLERIFSRHRKTASWNGSLSKCSASIPWRRPAMRVSRRGFCFPFSAWLHVAWLLPMPRSTWKSVHACRVRSNGCTRTWIKSCPSRHLRGSAISALAILRISSAPRLECHRTLTFLTCAWSERKICSFTPRAA